MNETNLDWSDLNLFLAVARNGGLAAGATKSNLSPPTLGRHMLRLERALGEVLFHRQARGYELTTAGQSLLIEAEAVEMRILNIQRRRSQTQNLLPIHISAGTWMTKFLLDNITSLNTPICKLVFQSTEAQEHIGRREATIGLRNQRPTDPSIAARKSASVAFCAYATPDCKTPNNWITSAVQTPSANWVKSNKKNAITIEVSHPRSLLDLALQGAGNVVLPCFVGDSEPALKRTTGIIPELTHDQWLVVHGEDRNQPHVRTATDQIASLITENRKLFEGIGSDELSLNPHEGI